MVSTRTILIYSFNVIFSIICVIGLSFQIKLVADYYFKYATVTEIMAVIPTKLYVPDLSLCIRYVDIFNMTRYTADTNITIADNLKQDYFTRVQNTVTIADIFHYTPNENEIFDSCLMRYSNSYNYERKNGARCYDEFNVTKYYIQEYLCYKFEWYTQADVEHDYRNIAYAVEFPGMFYNVNLELEPLKRANVMKLILHDTGYPYRSSSLAPLVLRQYNPASGKARYSVFRTSYTMMSLTLLEPPYQSDCRNYSTATTERSSSDCFRDCLVNVTISTFNKVPFSTVVSAPLHKKHISSSDVDNSTLSAILTRDEKSCYRACRQPDCVQSFTKTSVIRSETDLGVMAVMVNVPMDPSLNIAYKAKWTMTEFVIYVSSCIGTWFGLSAMSLNPFNNVLYRAYVHRQSERQGFQKLPPGGARKVCNYCSITRTSLMKEINADLKFISEILSVPHDVTDIRRIIYGGANGNYSNHGLHLLGNRKT